MATLQQLEKRLVEADAAGKTEDVRILANEIRKRRTLSQTQTAQPEDLSALDVAKDVGVSAAKGITKGIAGTLALPSMAQQGIDYLMRKIPGMSTTANVLEEFRQKNPPILGMPGLLTRTPTYQDIMGLVPQGLREYDPQTTADGS